MKKLLAVSILSLALCIGLAHAATPVIESQTIAAQEQGPSDADHAALVELSKFADEHNLFGVYRNSPSGKTFDVGLFETDKDGNIVGDSPKWVVLGAATLTDGVKQIEADFAQFPNGNTRDNTQQKQSGRQANV